MKRQRQKLDAVRAKNEVKEEIRIDKGEAIAVGDYVRVKGQETVGQVATIKGKDAELKMGALTSFVKLNRLEKVMRKAFKNQGQPQGYSGFDYTAKKADFSTKIDLRGLRAEEVIPVLNKWMDEAILLGTNELQVLHGKGNGVLRQITRNHLNTYPEVKSFKDEHADRGGAGVTIVLLV